MKKFLHNLRPQKPDSQIESKIEEKLKFEFRLEKPSREWSRSKTINVRGWLLPSPEYHVKAMRAVNNSKQVDLRYGSERFDVVLVHPDRKREDILYCGFEREIKFEDGSLRIEVDLGDGWELVEERKIVFSPEPLVDEMFDPSCAINQIENYNLLDNKKKYYYESAKYDGFKLDERDPKLIAHYLPQFHPIKENDETWGRGFTEWTNVTAARPRFVGHQQPILPADLGFYDLRLKDSLEAQITLAKKHGIYGFNYYYYWFSGKRLLEKPLDIFLNHPEWDFNFMITWANENWTKRWDGKDKEVIIAQKYLESDPLTFIKDVEHILLDPRYIRYEGKPVLGVYRGLNLGSENYAKVWREYFKKHHNKELYLVSMLNFDTVNPQTYGFDAGIEFAPLSATRRSDFRHVKPHLTGAETRLIDIEFEGHIVDYRKLALYAGLPIDYDFPVFRSVSPSWDNDARKKGKGTCFYASNPDLYGEWLDATISLEKTKTESPMIFINAWNEWAEGAILEPTGHFGNAVLNRTSEVLAVHSHDKSNQDNMPLYGLKKRSADIAVIVHVFYESEWEQISARLDKVKKIPFDLYVTLTEKTKDLQQKIKKAHPGVTIYIVPNRGRDVLPFLFLAKRLQKLGYKYGLKLHTKRTTHRSDGRQWLEELIDNLLSNEKTVQDIVDKLKNGAGVVGPAGHFILLNEFMGGNEPAIQRQINNIYDEDKAQAHLDVISSQGFFAGTMFWFSFESIAPILRTGLVPEDFESERGQIDGTLAHALERLLTIVPALEGKMVYESSAGTVKPVQLNEEYNFAASRSSSLPQSGGLDT